MMKDSQYEALTALPGFWRGRSLIRRLIAEQPGMDAVLQRRHLALANEYSQRADELARGTP